MAEVPFDEAKRFALAHHRAGQFAQAEAIYRQLLSRSRKAPELWDLLGSLLMQTGRTQFALPALRRAVELAPEVAQYHCNLGECLRRLGQADQAIVSLRTALLCDPELAVAQNNLGLALRDDARPLEAVGAFREAVDLKHDYAQAYSNLGNTLGLVGQVDEAVMACRKAVELDCRSAQNANNLGVALAAVGKTSEAIEVYLTAVGLDPNYAEAHTNLGNALSLQNDGPGSLIWYRKAIALTPDAVQAHWNLAVELLRQEDFAAGWIEHEWRLRARSRFPVRPFVQPQWRGEDIRGQTILLHAEQGFGDTLQFVRFVPMVAARGARVIFECQPELLTLFSGVQGADEIIARDQPPPDFHWQCPLLSLPLAFGTPLDTIPATVPYIRPNPRLAQRWNAELTAIPELKVGLCWAGSAMHSNDASRSIDPAMLEPLAVDGARFINLQNRPAHTEPPHVPSSLNLYDVGDRLLDFEETAALIANLDLVISVDTAVAHLAGAMGKPTWVMLPFVSDWRWMRDREDSPWYPTMRLLRQSVARDWTEVLRRVSDELRSLISRT